METCDRLRTAAPPELELPFGYADSGLTGSAHEQLEQAIAWLRCVPQGRAVLTVETERHYRNPEVDEALRRARLVATTRRLADAGVDASRLQCDGQPPDGAPALALRLYGRGW